MRTWLKNFLGQHNGVPTHSVSQPKGAAQTQPDRLASLATEHGRRAEFIKTLAEDGFYLIMKPGKDSNKKAFLDYSEGNTHIFPIFSSSEQAASFIRHTPHTEMVAYEVLGLQPRVLLQNDFSKSKLTLNPKSPTETEITPADLEELRKLVG